MSTLSLRGIRQISILQPFTERNFRLFWIGESISLIGDQFHFVALSWLTLQLTGSSLALGTVLMMAAVPRAVLMLVGGTFSDRLSPRSIMLWSNAIRAVLVFVLTGLVVSNYVALWHLYILAFAFGLVDAFFYPASMSIIPMLVDKHRLEAGNSLVQMTQQLSGLLGPAPAGLLVSAVGVAAAFGVDAATFVIAVIMLALIVGLGSRNQPTETEGDTDSESVLAGTLSGLRYAWHDPILRPLLLIIAVVNFSFAGPFTVGVAALADTRFAGGAMAFGVMLSAWGGGAVLGAVLAGSIQNMHRRGLIMIADLMVMGALLGVLGVAPTVLVAAGAMVVMGFGGGFINVIMLAWLQRRADDAMLGRVMSLVMFASIGLAPLSYAIAGAAASFDVMWMFLGAGALVLATSLYGVSIRQLRTID